MAAPFDLSGTYSADDGGIYFIRQLDDGSVTWAGLHQDGFHNGLVFTNVFQGQLEADGLTVEGDWVDVPRGGSDNAGTLTFAIVPADELGFELPVQLNKLEATGGFGGSTWTIGSYELTPQDILAVEKRVLRYDVPLAKNNPPCRDFSVMWGWIQKTTGPTLPPSPGDYCAFLAKDWIGQPAWNGDGDFSFDFDPDFAMLESTFWAPNHPWVGADFADELGIDWGLAAANEHILLLYDHFKRFHCEAAMFGRADDCEHPPEYLLPGWNQPGGQSVLVNGYPINGNLQADSSSLTFLLGPDLNRKITLTDGVLARVTGVVADDAGHEDQVPPEIHPLYAIDVIQDFQRTRGDPVVGPNLSGAWHGNDVGTYYVRQMGDQVWWLGLSRDQGRSFANVFRGTLSEGILEGSWVDVPMGVGGVLGTGNLIIFCGNPQATELIKISTTDTFGATRWRKLYDTFSGGPPVEG